jgi:hypothetical protein
MKVVALKIAAYIYLVGAAIYAAVLAYAVYHAQSTGERILDGVFVGALSLSCAVMSAKSMRATRAPIQANPSLVKWAIFSTFFIAGFGGKYFVAPALVPCVLVLFAAHEKLHDA